MTASYLTVRKLDVLARSLSDRERSIISSLGMVRIASALQLERLHFADVGARERRRVLSGLVAKQLLYRLPRAIGGARSGSAGFVYAQGIGAQRINQQGGRAQRPWTPSLPFLDHALACTELFVKLVEAQRANHLALCLWQSEPECWRSFVSPGGGWWRLKPDAFFTVQVGEHIDHYFVEVDRSSQSPRTLAKKCEAYTAAFNSGREQQRLGAFPRVLFVVPDEARRQILLGVIARQPKAVQPLFDVCVEDRFIGRVLQGADT